MNVSEKKLIGNRQNETKQNFLKSFKKSYVSTFTHSTFSLYCLPHKNESKNLVSINLKAPNSWLCFNFMDPK